MNPFLVDLSGLIFIEQNPGLLKSLAGGKFGTVYHYIIFRLKLFYLV
jgi:hypothetical protein